MTPDYASPEQIAASRSRTATDVYALGLLLYELLTGHRPYQFTTRTPEEIANVVCEEDPERPSTAVAHGPDVHRAAGAAEITTSPPQSVSETRDGTPRPCSGTSPARSTPSC